jgi:hypothetical protein
VCVSIYIYIYIHTHTYRNGCLQLLLLLLPEQPCLLLMCLYLRLAPLPPSALRPNPGIP